MAKTLHPYEMTAEILNPRREQPHLLLIIALIFGKAMLQSAVHAIPGDLPPASNG